ncbi:DUF2326 domain-containing protein [Vagococcus fluvialis]|uniref:DUF2326 domain-containing protein n=1 Tax=Vagococcus fluvialis TaxID=2738 RepID=UPI002B28DAF5|nr:DUF2326 domain-containing protein [Vagococcus fluvialis]
MKILNLKILDTSKKVIQDIKFNENGPSFIFGDVTKPKNKNETSNSIGKTLLLGFVNYFFGAKEDKNISKEEIKDWKLVATIKNLEKTYKVEKIIGSSNFIIDDKVVSLSEYKEFFNIDRSIYSKQINLSDRSSLIPAYNKNPAKDDMEKFLLLINLKEMVKEVDEYYTTQDKLKKNKSTKNDLLDINNWNEKDISAKLFHVEKRIEELSNEIEDIDSGNNEFELTEKKRIAIEEYSLKDKELKYLIRSSQIIKLENERLNVYLNEANAINKTAKNINHLFEKANYEVPEIIQKSLEEVQNFYKVSVLDRKKMSQNKIKENKHILEEHSIQINKLRAYLKEVDNIIRESDVFKEALLVYKQLNDELQNLMYEFGTLKNMSELNDNIESYNTNLNEIHSILVKKRKSCDDLVNDCREYINSVVKNLYSEDVQAFFDIIVKPKHERTRPIEPYLRLDGDSGEGVGAVRRRLIDLLIFHTNNLVDILIQDSSCFSGVDSRQISKLIEMSCEESVRKNKQYIVTLNRFQIDKDDNKLMDFIDNNTAILLSENNKLLGFDF